MFPTWRVESERVTWIFSRSREIGRTGIYGACWRHDRNVVLYQVGVPDWEHLGLTNLQRLICPYFLVEVSSHQWSCCSLELYAVGMSLGSAMIGCLCFPLQCSRGTLVSPTYTLGRAIWRSRARNSVLIIVCLAPCSLGAWKWGAEQTMVSTEFQACDLCGFGPVPPQQKPFSNINAPFIY